MKKERLKYKIIGAYDSETCNYKEQGKHVAYPILHQLGILNNDIENITHENVEDLTTIYMFRHTQELYQMFDLIIDTDYGYVPVILCHNLSFDMYALTPWFNARCENIKVLAKSARKPITITICDNDDNPKMVLWDTLIFSQQSLARMGADCGYDKASGDWDYDLIRTPETPLTDNELNYAKRDIYALFAWFGWFVRLNPDIELSKYACKVCTKTGIVRERRWVRFSKLKPDGERKKVGTYWLQRAHNEAPESDDELYTMQSCTRGGFTFCASRWASVPFDLKDDIVVGYDATSQHPAQIVSHTYPVNFHETTQECLDLAFNIIKSKTTDDILNNWVKPFPVAFNACFEFENIRPRKDSLFEKHGIYPLADSRYIKVDDMVLNNEQGDKQAILDHKAQLGYCDYADNAQCEFGKIKSARKLSVYITELTAWEICQAYEWDSVKAVHGYIASRFVRPCDYDVLSVMTFYKAKNEFKKAKEYYKNNEEIKNANEMIKLGIPEAVIKEMQNRTISDNDIAATYQGLKADLNAIFGINAANEYRRDCILTHIGIEYEGDFGICNAPKRNKVWYQFGQRIVGWSRIAQIVVMQLINAHVKAIINGDTDSIKVRIEKDKLEIINNLLSRLSNAIDKGKRWICSRIRTKFNELWDELAGIGHYVQEFKVKQFCASWNKAYCTVEDGHFNFTLAGIPTKKRDIACHTSINELADRMHNYENKTFSDICNLFLGYNVTYAYDLIRMSARAFPEWADIVMLEVKDYLGNINKVAEPAALAIYPMTKTINDTIVKENYNNMFIAYKNNPDINIDSVLITDRGVIYGR